MKSGEIKLRFFPKRQILRRPILGDMRHLILIRTRDITATTPTDIDFDESFTTTNSVYAFIETKEGTEVFDGTNLKSQININFVIRFIHGMIPYVSGLTEEKWIDYRDNRYDIVNVESYDERQIFMRLKCNLRGDKTKEVNKA
jgi:SPP1 family predicted phage head-tail adaptor